MRTSFISWAVLWRDERLIRHNGITTQLWAVRAFLDDRLALGVGGGAYFSLSHYNDLINGKSTSRFFSGIYTLTGSYRFDPHWDLRTSWSRIRAVHSGHHHIRHHQINMPAFALSMILSICP